MTKNEERKVYFEKCSLEQFIEDWIGAFEEYDYSASDIDEIKSIYEEIELPKRSTHHSAGYDFKTPVSFYLKPGQAITIPTGIRCHMKENQVLMMYPRSGLGSKYRLIPCNLTGVIDSDFYYADNEGNIHMRMVNDGDKMVTVEQGKAFCQGVIVKYFITDDDESYEKEVRRGGMGSTDKKNK